MKKSAEKTAGIDMSGFQSRNKAIDGQSPVNAGVAGVEVARKYTGVGSVMAAITREAEVSTELVAAREELRKAGERLVQYDAATMMLSLDPASIVWSRWANRHESEFSTQEFRQLKDEISQAGGNVQPIKVRVIDRQSARGVPEKRGGVIDGQSPKYEAVYGHRRHRACSDLGLPVNALVVEHMTDQELFAEMDRENRARKNLSAWEQGRMYDEALKNGLYPSIRRLAESLGVNQSDASRAIQLAKLPKEVVAAFLSPLDLQVRWAKPLTDALQRDPDGVLARARAVTKKRGKLGATEIFHALINSLPKGAAVELDVVCGGVKIAVLKATPNGRATIEFEPAALREDRHEELVRLLSDFLAKPARAP